MYKDRGIIKWAPFDALVGFKSLINQLIENQNKIEMPILLEDKIEEINYKLNEALKEKKEANVYYYENGYIKYMTGIIVYLDKLKSLLKLDIGNHIFLSNLLDIEIIN